MISNKLLLILCGCSLLMGGTGITVGAIAQDKYNKIVLQKGDQGQKGETGSRGEKGEKGETGEPGKDGTNGKPGSDGHNGLTPYIGDNGNWWIGIEDTNIKAKGESGVQGLQGEAGKDGKDGVDGAAGKDGKDGQNGAQGEKGDNGKDGLTPYIGDNGHWWIGTTDTNVSAQGPQGTAGKDGKDGVDGAAGKDGKDGQTGAQGEKGDDGEDGLSAFDIYLKYHKDYEGTEKDWINSLVNGDFITKEKYTVTFDSCGGNDVVSQEIESGKKALEPENPVRENYEFDGWYYNDLPWVFEGYSITENMCLTAHWKQIYTESLSFGPSEDGTLVVGVGDAKNIANVVIPSIHNGTPVSKVSYQGFLNCTQIKTITILDGVTSIGENAFEGMTNLTSIKLPNSITSIGTDAFKHCNSLKSIVFPDSLKTISRGLFYECDALESVTLGKNVTSIGIYSFYDCPKLKKINIPSSCKSIGEYAFYLDFALSDVTYAGSTSWSTGNVSTFYRCENGIYSKSSSANYSGQISKKFSVTINAKNFSSVLANGHCDTFRVDGNASDYFIWYYMHTLTRS